MSSSIMSHKFRKVKNLRYVSTFVDSVSTLELADMNDSFVEMTIKKTFLHVAILLLVRNFVEGNPQRQIWNVETDVKRRFLNTKTWSL